MTKKLEWVVNHFKDLTLDRVVISPLQTPAEALASRQEWQFQFIVGEPMGNEHYSASELKAMGLIGLYKEVEN